MIAGRYQSLEKNKRGALRTRQMDAEKARRPKYGMGTHVPGNKHPGQYRGGHKYKNANMPAAHS